MVNYENGCVYKLCCKNPSITEIYVGSTVCFKQRKSAHKSYCNNENSIKHNIPVYKFIRLNGCFINWDMIEIEKYSATDKKDLEKRERYWIESLKASLNHVIPSRTFEEHKEIASKTKKKYNLENKEVVSQKKKLYREKNKENLSEKSKIYYDKNRHNIIEKNKIFYSKNKEIIGIKGKVYREDKKEIYNERSKLYYKTNKTIVNEKNNIYYHKINKVLNEKKRNTEPIKCECGGHSKRLTTHIKTIKHKNWQTIHDFIFS